MVIRIYENTYILDYKPIIVSTFEEMRKILVKEFERVGNKMFSYVWFDDGFCASQISEKEDYEEDANKMLDMVEDRLKTFGRCIFHYGQDGTDSTIDILMDDSVEEQMQKYLESEKEIDNVEKKMEIRFYDGTNDKCNTIVVNNYDEIRAVIKSELKDAKNLEFSYCWLEDGFCDVCGEDEVYETDLEKMLDMAIDFFKKFNHCIFSYTELGLDGKIIRIELYTEEYVKYEMNRRNEQKKGTTECPHK